MTATRTEAAEFVATCIEAGGVDVAAREEFDMDAILDALYEIAGSWDVAQVEPEDFWPIVEAHVLAA